MDHPKTGNNAFTGSIPSAYGKMQSLQLLDVSHNQLSGSIPTEFFGNGIESETMTVFRASANNFVGRIPTTLGLFQQLNILALGT